MKYLVIGTGGVSGSICSYLARKNKDVTYITKDENLAEIKQNGLTFKQAFIDKTENFRIPVFNQNEYTGDTPDVIFLGVRGYLLENLIPLLERVSGPNTVIIPLLNTLGAGRILREKFGTKPLATDGCIYIVSRIDPDNPGVVIQTGNTIKIIFGLENLHEYKDRLTHIQKDLIDAGITALLTKNSIKEELKKFSFYSPLSALSIYYNIDVATLQVPGEQREAFTTLINEFSEVAKAEGYELPDNLIESNLEALDDLAPNATNSLIRDMNAGKDRTEIDPLVFEISRKGKKYGIKTPLYDLITERFQRD